jgi:hypothetical protein
MEEIEAGPGADAVNRAVIQGMTEWAAKTAVLRVGTLAHPLGTSELARQTCMLLLNMSQLTEARSLAERTVAAREAKEKEGQWLDSAQSDALVVKRLQMQKTLATVMEAQGELEGAKSLLEDVRKALPLYVASVEQAELDVLEINVSQTSG